METLGGQALIDRRRSAGYSRSEFARRVGISVRTLEGWETAAGSVPARKMHLVEVVLNQPADVLSTLNLIALLAARLQAGELASERLAQIEREHPELLLSRVSDHSNGPTSSADGSTVSGTSPGGDVTQGQQGKPRPRRTRGQDDDDE